MSVITSSRRQVFSATLDPKYIQWLKQLAEHKNIAASRLLEKAIELLKKEERLQREKKQNNLINEGIDFMLSQADEDQAALAESGFGPRIGEELL